MRLLTIKDAYNINYPIIYGLCDERNRVIKYVGRTINPYKRLQSYFYKKKRGNYKLVTWLNEIEDNLRFVILAHNPPNLNKMELYYIDKYKDQILNIDLTNSRYSASKSAPWWGGKSIKCPSEILFLYLINHKFKDKNKIMATREAIQKMTIKQRAKYESQLAYDYKNHLSLGDKMEAWANATSNTMLRVLEA